MVQTLFSLNPTTTLNTSYETKTKSETKSFNLSLNPINRKRKLDLDLDLSNISLTKTDTNTKTNLEEKEKDKKPQTKVQPRAIKRSKYDEPAPCKSTMLVILKVPVKNFNGETNTFYSFVDTHSSKEEVIANLDDPKWLSKLDVRTTLNRYNNRYGTSWRTSRNYIPSIDKTMKHILYNDSYPYKVKKSIITSVMRNIKFRFGSLCGQSVLQ